MTYIWQKWTIECYGDLVRKLLITVQHPTKISGDCKVWRSIKKRSKLDPQKIICKLQVRLMVTRFKFFVPENICTQARLLEILRGRSLKHQTSNQILAQDWNFQRDLEGQGLTYQRKPLWEGCDYFLEHHNVTNFLVCRMSRRLNFCRRNLKSQISYFHVLTFSIIIGSSKPNIYHYYFLAVTQLGVWVPQTKERVPYSWSIPSFVTRQFL